MIAAVVAALLPTRERQLYQYDCHESGGLVTQLIGFPTIDGGQRRQADEEHRDPYDLRECWPARGLIAGNVLSPDDEFANTPTYRMVRTMGRTGTVIDRLQRRPTTGAARTIAPRPAPSTGEEAVALLPEDPTPDGGSLGGSPPVQLAALTTPRPFPGGLATAPFGPGPGAGGGGGGGSIPPVGPPAGEGPGETPPTPTPTPTGTATPPAPGPNPTPTVTPTPVPTTPVPVPTTPVATSTSTPMPTPTSPPPIIPPVVPLVPEPATWLMLIVGFFAIGRALRAKPARHRARA